MNRFTLTVDGDRIQPIVAEVTAPGPGSQELPRCRVVLGEVTLDMEEDAAEDLADAIVDALAMRAAAYRPAAAVMHGPW